MANGGTEIVATTTPMPAEAQVPAPSTTAVIASHADDTHAVCPNCGFAASGHFCSNCGQKNAHSIHSVRHFIAEATEDLTHADSRVWGTIGALLFKPGFLTTEFLAGRRMKYLPPIRLYLVMSVLFFLILAISPQPKPDKQSLTPADRAEIERRTHGHEYFVLGAPTTLPLEQRREHARVTCGKMDTELQGEMQPGMFASAVRSVLNKGCLSGVEDNGQAIAEGMKHNLPRALFLTLPIMAAFMKLLYRRPERYYVEHLLFLLHDYTFIFLWLSVFTLCNWFVTVDWINQTLSALLTFYLIYYYFRATRRVYPEGVGSTVAKFMLLSGVYTVVALIALVATVLFSVLVQ
jgi:hypothetical protein